jgi:hypothetical protein
VFRDVVIHDVGAVGRLEGLLYSAMPIRERVQRLWRLVVDWWRPSTNGSPTAAVAPTALAASPEPTPTVPHQREPRRPPPAHSQAGEPIIAGAVTVRMWIVGGRLVLATSRPEAERALVTLLPELDADDQATARRLLDALRGVHAAAA